MKERAATRPALQLDATQTRAIKFIGDVYFRMTLALLTSAAIGYLSIQSGLLLWGFQNLGRGFSLAIFGSQLMTVIAFQGSIFKMKSSTSHLLFGLYAALTGLTLGMVGLIYTFDSIVTVGFAASAGFLTLVGFGKLTKRDLGPIGTFCIMGLMMLMVYSLGVWVASFFTNSAGFMNAASKIQGFVGVLLFAGITAYESQRLKKLAYNLAEQAPSDAAVEAYVSAGALNMYMNFIGIFLSLMRLMGSRR